MVLGHLTVASRKLVSVSRLSLVVVLALVLTSVYSITREGTHYAQAAAPTTLNFQGRLLASGGNLVPDGNYSIEFKLYNASSSAGSSQGSCAGDANCLWTETRTGGNQVEIKNGYFSAYLGDVSALPTNIWNQQLWLTMNVHNGTGWDGEMTPRIRLTSVPYAFRATVAESAETLFKNTGSFTGTVDFATMTADRRFLFPDTSLATTASPGTICVYNGAASNCPAASGSAYYIQNDTVLQTSSNFNIQGRNDTGSGTDGTVVGILRGAAGGQTVDLLQFQNTGGTVLAAVTAAGNLQVAASVDTRAAGTLSIGTSTATAITLGKTGITTTNAGALTVTELATFNGGATVASNLTVTQAGNVAFQRNTTDYTATGPQDDVNFGTGVLFRITSASALTLTSIANPADGRIITLANASSNVVTLQNDSGGTAVNRIITGTGSNLAVPAGSSVQLAYDSSTQRWRVIGGVATSGGGANQQLSNLSGTIAINASLTPGTDNTLDLGSGANSWRTLYADTSVLTPRVDTATGTTLLLGDTTATAITLGRTGITTTNAGALTVTELLTGSAGATIGGGAIALTGNAASSFTTSSGALTITSAAAATWSTAAGNLTVDSAAALQLGTTNATSVSVSKTGVTTTIQGALTVQEAATFNENVTIAASKTLRITGDDTAGRPVAPPDGTLYFDTDTQQLLIYAAGKWRADRSDVVVVAASDSNQAQQDAADFVADGTGDQSEINTALTAASGGKVYLMPGTYTTNAAIMMPDGTTLAGAGQGVTTIILDAGSSTVNAIEQSGSFITSIQDLSLWSSGTGGTQHGIYLDTNAHEITNVQFFGWDYGNAIQLDGAQVDSINNIRTNVSDTILLTSGAVLANFANNSVAAISLASGSGISVFAHNTVGDISVDASVAYIENNFTGAIAFTNASTGIIKGNSTAGAISLDTINGLKVSDNTVNTTLDDSIYLEDSDNSTITNNRIHQLIPGNGINISDAASVANYLSGNTSDNATPLVNDDGTGTIYGGQTVGTTDYTIQPAGTIELIANTNVTGTLSASVGVLTPDLDTATATTLLIGDTTATAITIGRTGITTTNAGALTVTQLLTANAGITASGGALSLTGNAASSLTTSSGALTITSAAAAVWSTAAGNLTVDSAAALQLGTTNATSVSISKTGVTTTINGALTVTELGTFNGGLTVDSNLTVTQDGNIAFQRNTTDYTATGAQDSINFGTGALFRITSASALTINGIAGGADGRLITLVNASANAVTIGNSASATPANHVVTGTGGSLSVPAGSTVQLAYDSASSVWRVIGGTATAGGGANQQLSNLSGTVAVNASLTPGTDGTLDLGSALNSWRTLYADTSVLTPTVDTVAAATLNIGTATANAVSISRTGVTTTVHGALTVSEATQLNANLTVANTGNVAFQANATSYTVTGTQELTLGTGVLHRITTATSTPILTGLTGGADGRIITLVNASANSLTIQNDSGGTAANRIITGSGVDSLIPAGGSVTLAYDSASSRWRIIGSSTGSIQLQASTPGTAQTGNFNVSGTGIAGTALQSPLFDTATAVPLGIGTINATNISIGHNGGTMAIDGTNFDLSTAGVLTLAGGQTRDITTANASTATGLTVKPGDSTGSNIAGPTLTLQGGAATAGNANGGSVTIAGGAGFGTGTQGLVNLSTTAFTSASVYTASSTPPTINNISVSDVNLFATIPVNATTATAIVSVPDPTISAIGRVLYITARDSSTDFTLRLNAASPVPIDIAMKRNSTATLIWNGDEWTAAGASSSTDLQSAYNNTLTSAGGAEIVLNPVGGNADGFTIRNNGTTPIIGGLLEVQSSTGSNLLSVNNNATEYAVNGGAETAANFSTNWTNTTGGVVSQSNDSGYVATGQYSTKVATTSSATNHGAKNVLSGALSSGMTYSVSFAVKGTGNFSGLEVRYSPDGSTTGTTSCTTTTSSTYTVTQGNWTRITCSFVASGSINSNNAILIRQTDSATHTYYIENLSVQVNANMTFAADGSVSSSLGSNWGTYNGAAPSSQSSTVYDGQYAVSVGVTATTHGVRNNMAVTPAVNTQYLVTFYARSSTGTPTLAAGFLPAGGNGAPITAQQCVDYNTQNISSTTWTRITCLVTAPSSGISDPDLVIYQTANAISGNLYIDALTITLNTNNSNNVQVGGVNKGGPTTLLTLDRAASAPIAANNDAYLGSMYYDTTTGRIQCYEADGWGACGSSPDNIITLTPEYAGAVLGGPGNGGTAGIGVMTSEFCSTEAGVLTLGTLCANHEARNYYHWTSPQATEQVYSIYVSYKLPTTFKEFNDSNTMKLTALTDSLTNAIATLQVFRKSSNPATPIASCGSATTINASTGQWEQTSFGGDERACGFAPGDNIIFKIDMKSKSNGNIYVENLDFVYNNN